MINVMKNNSNCKEEYNGWLIWIIWFIVFMILAFGCVQKNHPQLNNYEYYGNRQVPTWNVFINKDSVDKNQYEFKDPIQDSINRFINDYYK